MNRPTYFKVFTALFLIICLIPSTFMLIVGQSESSANEILASRPKLTEKDGSFNMSILNDTEDYIADRFAFRQELVTAWAMLNAKVFHTSSEEQVMLGKNGWLFYSETADDCMGISLSGTRLELAANNLRLIQEYVVSTGSDFVFTIAPNKGSLYSQFLPDSIIIDRDTSNAVQLGKIIKEKGINYADLFYAFEDEKVLYYATDSHWNSEGAALGADVILNSAGIDSSYYCSKFIPGEKHIGDLYEMLYPKGRFAEINSILKSGFTFTELNDASSGNAITINTENHAGEGSLFCWRDSFGISLYSYLAEKFEKAVFSRSNNYDLTKLAENKTTCAVIELVERNIDYLLLYPAIYPAPKRSICADARGSSECSFEVKNGTTASTADMCCISGDLPEEMQGKCTEIYVRADGTVYAAGARLSDDTEGFSLWLSADTEKIESLICCADGKNIEYIFTEKGNQIK